MAAATPPTIPPIIPPFADPLPEFDSGKRVGLASRPLVSVAIGLEDVLWMDDDDVVEDRGSEEEIVAEDEAIADDSELLAVIMLLAVDSRGSVVTLYGPPIASLGASPI